MKIANLYIMVIINLPWNQKLVGKQIDFISNTQCLIFSIIARKSVALEVIPFIFCILCHYDNIFNFVYIT